MYNSSVLRRVNKVQYLDTLRKGSEKNMKTTNKKRKQKKKYKFNLKKLLKNIFYLILIIVVVVVVVNRLQDVTGLSWFFTTWK